MRPVSSLIQNHRQFTATATAAIGPPTLRSARQTQVTTHVKQSGTAVFRRNSPILVSFLTVCLQSPSVAVTAMIHPPESTLFWTQIIMPRPGLPLVQSPTENTDWLSFYPITWRLNSTRQPCCPVRTRESRAAPLLTERTFDRHCPHTIEKFGSFYGTVPVQPPRGTDSDVDAATAQEDALSPPWWREWHLVNRNYRNCRKWQTGERIN